MANKTIPQLPEQTGKTDNDLLAIVDSGETTTSKIKVSTLLAGVGGAFQVGDATDSIVPSYSPTSRGVATGTTYVDKLNIEGEVSLSNTNETFILNSDNTTITDHPYNRAFAGTTTSRINSTDASGKNILIATTQGQINGGNSNIVIGQGIIQGGSGHIICGGEFTHTISSGNKNAMLGGASSNCGGTFASIVGGANNATAGFAPSVVGGRYNQANSQYSGVFVGRNNVVSGQESVIAGGNQHDITGNYNFIGGGAANDIQGQISAIIGGNINNIGSSGGFSAIVGGASNNVNHNYSVVLGGQSQTTLQDDEVVVPKLRTTQYASLNFSGDTAAAAAGVQLGEFYHDNGQVRIRIT